MNSLLAFEPFINSCTDRLIEQFNSKDGKVVDLAWWLQAYAFDSVGELALGKSFGLLDTGKDEIGVLAALDFLTQRNSIVGQLTPFQSTIHKSWFNKLLEKWYGINGQKFRVWTTKVVSERLSQDQKEVDRPDMFTLFRKSKEPSGQYISVPRLYTEVFTVL